jgi:drug/metabolite transporter (DMT)-like permease
MTTEALTTVGRKTTLAKRDPRVFVVGFAWAALTVAIFSGWFVVTRLSMTHQLRIWDIIAFRFGVGGLLLLPFLIAQRRALPPRAWLEGLLFAVLWGAPFVFLVGLGIHLTSAALASSITPALMPVFAGLIGRVALKEPLGLSRLLGYAGIVAGLIALAATAATGVYNPVGVLLLILGAVTWAIYTLLFRRSHLSPMQSAALICFWSALIFLPVYFFLGLSHIADAPLPELLVQIIYQGVLMSVVAIAAFNRAVTLLGAGAATAIIALLPAIVSTLSIPILGETPGATGWLAIATIAVGVILAARPKPSLS